MAQEIIKHPGHITPYDVCKHCDNERQHHGEGEKCLFDAAQTFEQKFIEMLEYGPVPGEQARTKWRAERRYPKTGIPV